MVYVNERLDHLPSSHFYSDVGVNPAVNLGYLRYLPYHPFAISRGTRGVHIFLILESAIHRCPVLSFPIHRRPSSRPSDSCTHVLRDSSGPTRGLSSCLLSLFCPPRLVNQNNKG